MSGHSHWATIKHKKGAIDAKRGKLWSKLSRAIIIAARNGGGDPEMNLKLRYAIDKARSVSMPKDNIERAVKRGTGELEGMSYEEVVYEGYGPSGVAIMVETLTDNRNRTVGEIAKIFERGGGKMGVAGCAAYMFERKGLFVVDAAATDEDTLLALALEGGADDVKRQGSNFEVICEPAAFNQVQEALKNNNIAPTTAEITQLCKAPVEVSDPEDARKILRLMDALDDHDDAQQVYTTANLSEELVSSLGDG